MEVIKKYDYLIVGAGLFGAVMARQLTDGGKRCLVIDKRDMIGGNVACKRVEDISVHQYGAHIFHTSDQTVWKYVTRMTPFNQYVNCPIANYKGKLYHMPFNLDTYYALWNVKTPEEARKKIAQQVAAANIVEPKNLEEKALSLVGKDLYETLVKGYTEKQWGKKATELPASIIERLPLRFTFNNNYFNDCYQGIPIGGYQELFNSLLEDVEVRLHRDFLKSRKSLAAVADKVIYTGAIDEYYDECYGALEYRSLRFEHEILPVADFQGNAVINYTEYKVPYTRIIEHKHFEFLTTPSTVITREYPDTYTKGKERYYTMNNSANQAIYQKYADRAATETDIIFGGRLGDYKYYDMHHVVANALKLSRELLQHK